VQTHPVWITSCFKWFIWFEFVQCSPMSASYFFCLSLFSNQKRERQWIAARSTSIASLGEQSFHGHHNRVVWCDCVWSNLTRQRCRSCLNGHQSQTRANECLNDRMSFHLGAEQVTVLVDCWSPVHDIPIILSLIPVSDIIVTLQQVIKFSKDATIPPSQQFASLRGAHWSFSQFRGSDKLWWLRTTRLHILSFFIPLRVFAVCPLCQDRAILSIMWNADRHRCFRSADNSSSSSSNSDLYKTPERSLALRCF
jgi:hypothetical protein